MPSSKISLDQQHSIIEASQSYGLILDSREIFIFGAVDDEGELGNKFLTNIQILTAHSTSKPIVVHQHSIGGDWCCGMVIFDAIVSCPCPIIFVCHGIAASMGSIIPTACVQHGNSYRITMPNCDWLIHDGYTSISEFTHKQTKSWVEWEASIKKKMMYWYVDACKTSDRHKDKTDRQVLSFIQKKLDSREDWWLSAREAVEHGFADAVLGDEGFESINVIKKYWNN